MVSLNFSIEKLNHFIESHEGKRDHRKLESFTDTEVEEIMGKTVGDGAPTKAVMLALVSMHRLDLVTEHAVKVFRVRRFY